MGNEGLAGAKFVVDRLSANAKVAAGVGTRIYEGHAPDVDEDTDDLPEYPFIIFNMQAAPDSLGGGASRIMTSPVFMVKVIGESSYEDIRSIGNGIDEALQQAGPTLVTLEVGDAYNVLGSYRIRAHMECPVVDGIEYPELGGDYRMNVQAA